jgi:hypothetical protein
MIDERAAISKASGGFDVREINKNKLKASSHYCKRNRQK